jgi:succinate dehydrogenase flavin-adding protein (antitoxin of CptAB toxin-antitoxin module)
MQDELTAAIAADIGIADLPLAEQQTLIAQFGEVALKAATLSVLEKLSEEKRNEFSKIAETGDAEALKTFLDREVPEHEELAKTAVDDEVRRFKEFQAK